MKNWNSESFLSVNERSLSIILFSLYSAWLLAFPFEGQILYAFGNKYELDIHLMVFGSIAAHFFGLIIAGFLIKTINGAKKLTLFFIISALAMNIFFFFNPSLLWYIFLPIVSFLAGMSVSSWGFFFKRYSPSGDRLKTAANVLIYSNILMIALNMTAIHISPEISLGLAQILLTGALFFTYKLPTDTRIDSKTRLELIKSANSIKPLIFLCLFIFIITINSGLMYQVINPTFAHLEYFVSWYWALPYIVALYIMKNLPDKINRTYILYVAISMIGLSFLFFMIFDNSAASYFIINTLLMGACGVYDIFWWSILGSMLDLYNNPAKILGAGLSANVLGVLAGGVVGNAITSGEIQKFEPSIMALIIVFTILMILPILHKRLSLLLKNHLFLLPFYEILQKGEPEQEKAMDNLMIKNGLTEREMEIAGLLLKGRTYKMVARELYLSENTVKTHIKNIYAKFNIQSKAELFNIMMEHEKSG